MYIILTIVLIIVLATAGSAVRYNRRLSMPAQRIMKMYNSLPKSSQDKIHALDTKLRLLDKQLGREDVDAHYTHNAYKGYNGMGERKYSDEFSWSTCYKGHVRGSGHCKFHVYQEIRSELHSLEQAVEKLRLEEQKRGLDVLNISSVVEDIRNERGTVESMTNDIKKLGR